MYQTLGAGRLFQGFCLIYVFAHAASKQGTYAALGLCLADLSYGQTCTVQVRGGGTGFNAISAYGNWSPMP